MFSFIPGTMHVTYITILYKKKKLHVNTINFIIKARVPFHYNKHFFLYIGCVSVYTLKLISWLHMTLTLFMYIYLIYFLIFINYLINESRLTIKFMGQKCFAKKIIKLL
jgi:hypothetical protein